MRNYRTLTTDEIKELEQLYPVTTNRELSRRFDISVDAIQDSLARPRGWVKDRKAVYAGNRGGRTLNEQEVAWIVKHFKHTKNKDIMLRFGIGEATLHRIARKHGLKKSRQQMHKMQAEATEEARRTCRSYGIYDQTAQRMREVQLNYKERGERNPNGFLPGQSNKDRLSPKRFRECMDKIHRKRNETIRRDRARITFGLPQKTKLKLTLCDAVTLRKRAYYRWQLDCHNYIVERGATTVYYDEQTCRSAIIETNAQKWGIRIVSDMPDEQPRQNEVRVIHPPRQYETW